MKKNGLLNFKKQDTIKFEESKNILKQNLKINSKVKQFLTIQNMK